MEKKMTSEFESIKNEAQVEGKEREKKGINSYLRKVSKFQIRLFLFELWSSFH